MKARHGNITGYRGIKFKIGSSWYRDKDKLPRSWRNGHIGKWRPRLIADVARLLVPRSLYVIKLTQRYRTIWHT